MLHFLPLCCTDAINETREIRFFGEGNYWGIVSIKGGIVRKYSLLLALIGLSATGVVLADLPEDDLTRANIKDFCAELNYLLLRKDNGEIVIDGIPVRMHLYAYDALLALVINERINDTQLRKVLEGLEPDAIKVLAEQTNAAPEIKGELVYQATITRAEDISLFFINAGCSTGWRPKNIKELPV